MNAMNRIDSGKAVGVSWLVSLVHSEDPCEAAIQAALPSKIDRSGKIQPYERWRRWSTSETGKGPVTLVILQTH
jgi:hypothetical protein